MNAKERQAVLKEELTGLVASVKSGDESAIERAEELVDELEEVGKLIEKAEEKAAIMEELGKTSSKRSKEIGGSKMDPKNLGEAAVEALKKSGIVRGQVAGTAVADFDAKAATDTIVSPSPGDVEYQGRVVDVRSASRVVRDLMPEERVSAPTFGYYKYETEGTATAVLEDGEKPQTSGSATLVTESLKTYGHYLTVTDEMLEDYGRLVPTINSRAVYLKDLAVDAALINGNGQGGTITGFLNVDGTQTATYAQGADAQAIADAIYGAALDVKEQTGYDADAVIMNPADYKAIRLAKDENGQYFGGGYSQNAYGNGDVDLYPGIWGLKVALSSNITQGTFIIGAFGIGAAVATKGGTRVEMGYNGTDFSHDRVSLRAVDRVALEVFVPEAFVILTEAE